ncbi:transferrin-like protein, partial [Leptotrombidium deliense]
TVTKLICNNSKSTLYVTCGEASNQRRIYSLYLQQLLFRPGSRPTPWLTRFFISNSNVSSIEEVPPDRQTWEKYLDNFVTSIEQPLPGCERRNVTFCVTSPTALSKCLDMQKVAYTRRIRPDVRCINPGDSRSACIEAIKNQKADVMTLDAGEMYQAARYEGLRPIARERNSYSNIASYAVAVIRAPSEITSLSMLVNSTSCHAGYNTIEGWIAPVGALIEEGLMEKFECDRAKQVSEFFSGSCVPGAIDYKYRLNATEVLQLCKQCVGDVRGEHFCFDSPSERFAGPAGAFRCLAEGRGDVAFVNHLIPFKYTDGRSFEFWTRSLRSDDFRLLCRQGGQGYLNDYEKCNLAKIPSNFIVMSSNASDNEYIDNVNVVIQLSDELSRKSEHSFKIFGTYYNVSDLIFSDTTTNIIALPEESGYEEALDDYLPILEDMDPEVCGAAFQHSANNLLLSLAILTFYLIFKTNSQ